MVIRKNLKESFALISVFNKKNLSYLCKNLIKHRIKLVSTGTTSKKIIELGYKTVDISSFTKFKEILGGRVKTLHPKIYASLLFKRNNKKHILTFKKLKFPIIDFVIVNLYPFNKTLKKTKDQNNIIEMIDIGGSALLRSSAKNFESVTTICETKDYTKFITNLNTHSGKTSEIFRKKMALKVFKHTSKYDQVIFKWFNNSFEKKNKKSNLINLKYGENPYQKSYFMPDKNQNIFDNQIQGKKLGYNNILDITDGLKCLSEFSEPTCVIIKHNNPCGVASALSIKKAFINAYNADNKSAFGGVVLLNRVVDKKLANLILKYFFEVVVAKNFNKDAKENLGYKKNLILITLSKLKSLKLKEIKSVVGGKLIQEKNTIKISHKTIKLVSRKKTNLKALNDLIFAFKVAKHVKSNAIVLVNNKQTIGIGAGQMSRFDATRLALIKKKDNFRYTKFVCASDAFFPFTDNLKLLIKNNCNAVVQPMGSKNDNKIIQLAIKNNLPLYFTKSRVFKH